MKRRPVAGAATPEGLLSVYTDRAWNGSFVDWCRQNNVEPLAVLRASAQRKRRAS